jgi:hypothetical protein
MSWEAELGTELGDVMETSVPARGATPCLTDSVSNESLS